MSELKVANLILRIVIAEAALLDAREALQRIADFDLGPRRVFVVDADHPSRLKADLAALRNIAAQALNALECKP